MKGPDGTGEHDQAMRPAVATVADPLLADCVRRLRQAGLRVTRPRLLVLSFLTQAGGHHSVDEIAHGVRRRGGRLGHASVYNVVHSLTAHGLLMVAEISPGRTLYELAERWHHHFVCRQCGRVWDVPCLAGSTPCLRPADFPGEVEHAQVILRGRCADCASGEHPGVGSRRPHAASRREDR